MQAVAERNPVVGQAFVRVMEMSADEKLRYQYEARLKAELDYNTRMRGARREGIAEGERNIKTATAKRLLARNMPLDEIMAITDLTRDEIESLKD